jgi:hypothetical protein
MPNGLAYAMLLVWPVVTALLFARLPPGRALLWTILGGYLVLPPLAAFDLPALPPLNKETIPNLCAAVAVVLGAGATRARAGAACPQAAEPPPPPLPLPVKLLLVLFVVSPFATVLTNGETLVFPRPEPDPPRVLPALRLYDSISAVASQLLLILPFFLARRLLAGPGAMRDVVGVLAVAGLAYSLPMLLEVRLSPQLNIWVYGFFQHDFLQMMRDGGFRPIVFLPHALWATFFLFTTLVAAASLARRAHSDQRPALTLAVLWLAATLVLSKTLGPMILAAAVVPAVLLLGVRMQLRIAAVLGIIALAYPLLRGAGVVPLDVLMDQAAAFSPARAESLGFRLGMEDMLLAHAGEKPWFGWGGWGRNHVYDPWTGRMLTVADGRWIIVLGIYGWLGYIAEFGLLALPLVMMARSARRLPEAALPAHVGAVALILGANLIDLIPNATLVPFTWVLAGAILGQAPAPGPAPAPEAAAPAVPARRRTVL